MAETANPIAPEEPFPEAWLPGLDALVALPIGGVALLMGAPDRGKTTFAASAARRMVAQGLRVAVVDADVGQPAIGPPGTVGVFWADAQPSVRPAPRSAVRYFAGAFSPAPIALELTAATARAIRWARDAGAERIVVDTSGFVAGPAARRFWACLCTAISPQIIIGFQNADEIAPLLELAACCAGGAPIVFLATPEFVIRKSAARRATRRRAQMGRAFEAAEEMRLTLRGEGSGGVLTLGTTLGTGAAVAPHLRRWIGQTLRAPVVRAEVVERDGEANGLVVWMDGSGLPQRAGWEADLSLVGQHFEARGVRVLHIAQSVGAFVGLLDAQGRLLSVGRFAGLVPETVEARVQSAVKTPADVRVLHFGRIRIGPDGVAHDAIGPGEL